MQQRTLKMCDKVYGDLGLKICPRKTLALVLVALLALPLMGLSQQLPPPPTPQMGSQGTPQKPPQGPGVIVTTTNVRVPVTVKDANGELVNNLRIQDFRILEDNVEQRIVDIRQEAIPISAVVLIDDAMKSKPQQQVQASLRAISAGMSDADEAAIFRFDQYPQQMTDFINGPDKLLTQLDRIQISTSADSLMVPDNSTQTSIPRTNGPPGIPDQGPAVKITALGDGTKSVNDALYAAAQLLRTRPKDRMKVIFIVSDGAESKGNKYSFDDTVKMLLLAESSVYSIGIGTLYITRPVNVLSKFAHATGGDIFYASSAKDLENIYPRISDQVRNQYTLFYSPDHKDHTVTYHSIDVRVRRGGLTVLARDGYFSAPTP
jgi:Ca-activated chloride channel family protein